MNKCIVILTAIPEEQEAVLKVLGKYEKRLHPETKTDYYEGECPTNAGMVKIIVSRTNQTNVNAGAETERAIGAFHPSHIFYVGVAGGLKDVKVGDIVIGSDVYGYERGKAKKQFLPRPQFGFSSYNLDRAAYAFSMTGKWKDKAATLVDKEFSDKIRTYPGTIASGEKVDASEKSALHKFLKQQCSHALAIDMEGLGFLNTCRAYPHINSLLLRGISDLINDKGEMDGKGSQPYASQNVAAFVFGLISELSLTELKPFEEKDLKGKLFEIVCKLYPRGVEDKGIWARAGGDLSQVTLNTQGKAQWTEALRLLENGGGGNIIFKSLVEVMAEDAPGNEGIQNLIQEL